MRARGCSTASAELLNDRCRPLQRLQPPYSAFPHPRLALRLSVERIGATRPHQAVLPVGAVPRLAPTGFFPHWSPAVSMPMDDTRLEAGAGGARPQRLGAAPILARQLDSLRSQLRLPAEFPQTCRTPDDRIRKAAPFLRPNAFRTAASRTHPLRSRCMRMPCVRICAGRLAWQISMMRTSGLRPATPTAADRGAAPSHPSLVHRGSCSSYLPQQRLCLDDVRCEAFSLRAQQALPVPTGPRCTAPSWLKRATGGARVRSDVAAGTHRGRSGVRPSTAPYFSRHTLQRTVDESQYAKHGIHRVTARAGDPHDIGVPRPALLLDPVHDGIAVLHHQNVSLDAAGAPAGDADVKRENARLATAAFGLRQRRTGLQAPSVASAKPLVASSRIAHHRESNIREQALRG